MSTSQDIGTRIRMARRERGLTQDDLADQVGVSRSAVAQWETGRTGQITGNLSRIADVLEVNVEYLMFGTTNGRRERCGKATNWRCCVYTASAIPRIARCFSARRAALPEVEDVSGAFERT